MARDEGDGSAGSRPPGAGDGDEPGDRAGADSSQDLGDLGEPIALLSDLALDPSPGFFGRFHRRVNRRLLVSDVATFSWKAWAQALLDYLVALFGSLGAGRDTDKGAG